MALTNQNEHQDGQTALAAVLDVASVPDGARGILAAAANLFARNGYGPTTVRNIAAAADVTVPMVYYYFGGKEQIFVTLFDSLGKDFFSRFDAIKSQQGLSFHEELVAIARVFRSLVYPCPVISQLMTQSVFGPPESRPPIDDHGGQEAFYRYLENVFDSAAETGRFSPTPGFSSHELSAAFLNIIRGHTVCAMKQMEFETTDNAALYEKLLTDEALGNLVDLFLNGAGQQCSPR